jgi:AcrR family transcriptional regulator
VERTLLYNVFVPSSSSDNPDAPRVTGERGDPGAPDGPAASDVPSTPGVIPSPPRSHRHRRPTRRTAITLDAIVAAAVETVDESGVAGLTMRRVAERLGTGAASLYAHVSGRDELLELTFDELAGQVPLPTPDPRRWRDQVVQMFEDLYRILIAHGDAALAGMGRVPTSPKALDAGEALASVMSAGGLTDRAVALGIDRLLLFTCAAAFEDGILRRSGMAAEEEARYRADLKLFFGNLPSDRFPTLARTQPQLSDVDGAERLRFGLEALLAGVEALSDAERAR